MARNDITDDANRAVTDTAELADGELVVYERRNPDAWLCADTTADLAEVR